MRAAVGAVPVFVDCATYTKAPTNRDGCVQLGWAVERGRGFVFVALPGLTGSSNHAVVASVFDGSTWGALAELRQHVGAGHWAYCEHRPALRLDMILDEAKRLVAERAA